MYVANILAKTEYDLAAQADTMLEYKIDTFGGKVTFLSAAAVLSTYYGVKKLHVLTVRRELWVSGLEKAKTRFYRRPCLWWIPEFCLSHWPVR